MPIWIALIAFSFQTFALSSAQLEMQLQKNPSAIRTRVQLAMAYAQEKKPDKIVATLNSYTDQLDDNAMLLLASSYAEQKDHANEARVITILTKKDENNFRWHMLLGQAYLKQSSQASGEKASELLTSAIQQLRQTLQLNKKFKPAFDLLLQTLLTQKANNEARELVLEGVEKFGERPELYRELCRLDAVDGYLVQAIKSCRRSIELSPTYPDHYVYLVQALSDQGEDNQAERNITSAAKRFAQSEFVQWAAGKIYLQKKNYSVASRYFQAAVKADPKQGRSQFGLAQSLYESGQENEALSYFVQACKLDSSTQDTFFSSGSRLKQKGNMELGSKYTAAANTCRGQ